MSVDVSSLFFTPGTVGALMFGVAAAGSAAMGVAMLIPKLSRKLMPLPKETRLVDFMPFLHFLKDGSTILTKRGDYVRVLKLGGAEMQVASKGEQEQLYYARRTWLTQLAEKGARARIFTIRSAIRPGDLMEHPVPHLKGLANRWEQAFERNSFMTEHYAVISTGKDGGEMAIEEACNLTISGLNLFKPKLLGVHTDESPLKILARLASPISRPNPKPIPGADVSEQITADTVHFSDDKAGSIVFSSGTVEKHVAILGIKSWGDLTEEKMLQDLASLPFDYTIFHHIEPLSRAKATTQLDVAFRFARTTYLPQTAAEQFEDVREIVAGGGNDSQSLCNYALNILVEGPDEETLIKRISDINTVATQYQVTTVREGIVSHPIWWSMFPTYDTMARPWKPLASNVALLLAMQRNSPGADFSPWGKSPVTLLRTAVGSPYKFVFHDMSDPGNKEPLGHMLVVGPSGSGKAQPMDAPVLTATGWSTMGDMRLGRMLRMPDGSLAPVTGIHPQGVKDVWQVEFEDGRKVECCLEHLWKVWNPDRRAYDIVELSEVMRRRDVATRSGRRISIPLIDPDAIEMPAREQPIPAYALGAILGDGTTRKRALSISTAEPEHTIARIEDLIPDYEFVPEGGVDFRARMRNEHATALYQGAASPYQVVLEHEGRSQTIREWAAEIGASPSRLALRRNQGWTEAQILGLERRPRSGRDEDFARYAIDGRQATVSELAGMCDVPKNTIRERLVRGWSVEQAIGRDAAPTRKGWGESPLVIKLRDLGLWGRSSHDKFVPEAYKNGSVAQRFALMQGLMDTDGSAEGTGASFSSTSERLARDVQEIAWSLGAIASIAPRQTHYTDKDGIRRAGRPSWRVSIRHPQLDRFFSLPRKVASCRVSTTARRLAIKSIEMVGRKEMQCISVGHPEHLYLTNDYVVTHNTVTVSWLAMMAMRYPDLRVFFFDRFFGTEVVTNMCGGRYVKFDGSGAAMNPLQMDLNDGNRDYLNTWLRLITGLTDSASAEQFGNMLEMLELMPKEARNLKKVWQTSFAPDSEARSAIRPWINDNQYGNVFCAAEDSLDLSNRMLGFDFTTILDPERADALGPAVVSYIMHRTMDVSVKQGHPALYFVDETAPLLKNEYFAHKFSAGLKEGRKLGQVFICAFQTPSSIIETGHAQTIMGQCATQIFFPNPKAKAEDLEFFNMTSREIDFCLGRTHNHLPRKFLLRRVAGDDIESIVIDADMRTLGDGLATFASGNASVRMLREMMEKDPENFRQLYMDRVAAERAAA